MTEPRGSRSEANERLVPSWLENLAALGWRVLAIAGFALVLWYLATLIWNVVLAIGLAIVVAVVLAPVVLRLRDGGRSRAAAAGIAWVATIGAIIGLLILLTVTFLPYLVELAQRLREGNASLQSLLADAGLPTWLYDLSQQVIAATDSVAGDAVPGLVGSLANLAGILLIGAFLLFFFLKDGDKAWLWLFGAMPESKRELITSTGDDALARVGGYVRANTVTAAISAISSFLFMLVLGTPLAMPLAFLTFVLGFVPFFGNAIAAFVITLVTLAAAGSTPALAMAVLLIARIAVVHWFVEPRLFGAGWRLHPVVVLIALPVGFHLGGLVGLIIAVPIAAVGRLVVEAAIAIMRPETAERLPETVPPWLDRAAQWSWRGIVAVAFVGLLVVVLLTFPLVVLPVILALILAATTLPLLEALLARGRSRNLAAAITVGGSAVAILCVVGLAMVTLVRQAEALGETTTSGAETVDESANGSLGIATQAIDAGVQVGVGIIGGLGDELVAIAAVTVLAVLLTFYFLRDGAGLWQELMTHVPGDAAAELSAAGGRAFGVLGGYMVGTGAISLAGAASQLVIMWILDLPLALPIFVLSFFGGFIPYIGSFLTTGAALLVAVAVGDPIDILVMAVWTGVFNIVQGNVVAPLVYNRTTAIHPAVVLAAIPAGAAVAGILGMFLVVPALGVVATTWRSVLRVMGASEDEIPGPRPEEPPPRMPEGTRGDTAAPAAAPGP